MADPNPAAALTRRRIWRWCRRETQPEVRRQAHDPAQAGQEGRRQATDAEGWFRSGTLRCHNGPNRPFPAGRFWAWLIPATVSASLVAQQLSSLEFPNSCVGASGQFRMASGNLCFTPCTLTGFNLRNQMSCNRKLRLLQLRQFLVYRKVLHRTVDHT
jgi:hypothetical protein